MSRSPAASADASCGIVGRLRTAGCVFAEDEAQLLIAAARTPAELAAMVDARAAGRPLEHVLGWVEFCGLRVAVDPGIFVPRRRSELLVRQAARLAAVAARAAPTRNQQGAVVVDMCCGSGAVGLAVAVAVGAPAAAAAGAASNPVELYAVDIDPAAVRCARGNLAAVGGRVYEGHLYEPLPARLRGRVDVLVANVPYVPTEEIELLPAEARLHEPRIALDGGADGLEVLRRVTARASRWLVPGGHLLVETSEGQAAAAVETFGRGGLVPQVVSCEELDATVVIGAWPGS